MQKANLLQATDRNAQADRVLTDSLPANETPRAVEGLMFYALTHMFNGHGDKAMTFADEAVAKARNVYRHAYGTALAEAKVEPRSVEATREDSVRQSEVDVFDGTHR